MRPIFIKFLEFVDHVEVIVCNFLGLTDLNNIFKLNLKNHDFLKLLNFYPGGAGKHETHFSCIGPRLPAHLLLLTTLPAFGPMGRGQQNTLKWAAGACQRPDIIYI